MKQTHHSATSADEGSDSGVQAGKKRFQFVELFGCPSWYEYWAGDSPVSLVKADLLGDRKHIVSFGETWHPIFSQ